MTARGAWRLGSAVLTALLAIAALSNPLRAQPADSTVRDIPSELAAIPAPVGFVNDHAQVLGAPAVARLEAFLDQVQKKTGVEFAILTMPSVAPETPEQYKVRAFERWGIGQRGRDEGLLMLLVLDERALRFETGYGLEGTLPDGLQSRIFREVMRPRFRAGDYEGGITAGVLEVARRIGAEKQVALEWNGEELRYSGAHRKLPPWAVLLLLGVVVIVVMAAVSASRHSGPRGRRGWNDWGGWGGGFGGGLGGGGWSGGGSFGGGSFGGFGGGASGGGGGGGNW